jgi:hypothetical protein
MLSKKFFRDLSYSIRKEYVKQIFNKGKDVYGRPFKGYTTEYGKRKRGNEFKRQSTAFANKTSPVLTGDFMNDAKPSSTSGSASVKWAAYGSRVKYLHEMGRKVTDDRQPFPKGVISMINRKVNKEIDKQFPKNKKIVIKIQK